MPFDLQPYLENELVQLRPLKSDDFEALYEVAKNPLIWEQHQNSDRWKPEVFKSFFKGAIDSKSAFAIIEKKGQKIIGSSRYKISENSPKAVEIGWTFLSKEYWGGVYNKSFKFLMIAHAFKHFDHILFHINEKNYRSQKATEKLGGMLIDDHNPFTHLRNTKKDALTYIITKKD